MSKAEHRIASCGWRHTRRQSGLAVFPISCIWTQTLPIQWVCPEGMSDIRSELRYKPLSSVECRRANRAGYRNGAEVRAVFIYRAPSAIVRDGAAADFLSFGVVHTPGWSRCLYSCRGISGLQT